ncbi:hypothetical protein NBC122_02208 [Chryseobacterium salivictor]|uniref:Uncharacterized protein n=1 Tax=Chryseobacterium salivictor TaxID=2547600 RepID=A0A4V1AL98_9FLAO|nr:hypothetical protein NBC122_02208 [Chryseobacterium salivictor]
MPGVQNFCTFFSMTFSKAYYFGATTIHFPDFIPWEKSFFYNDGIPLRLDKVFILMSLILSVYFIEIFLLSLQSIDKQCFNFTVFNLKGPYFIR